MPVEEGTPFVETPSGGAANFRKYVPKARKPGQAYRCAEVKWVACWLPPTAMYWHLRARLRVGAGTKRLLRPSEEMGALHSPRNAGAGEVTPPRGPEEAGSSQTGWREGKEDRHDRLPK